MTLKTISAEKLALETAKVLAVARKRAVAVTAAGKPTLVLRPLLDDDLADELVVQHPEFRRSIRRARRDRRKGKSISLAEARRMLGLGNGKRKNQGS